MTTMHTQVRCAMRWLLLAAALPALAGCSGMNWGLADSPSAKPSHPPDRRKERMIREFDARRNTVQVQAAQAALERGAYRESEETLRAVLQRDDTHRDARLLLAELLFLTDRRPEAFTQLEHALREHQTDPRVHYGMAVMLDAAGRPDDARIFYEQSAELNSNYQLYAKAHETAVHGDRKRKPLEPPFLGARPVDDALAGQSLDRQSRPSPPRAAKQSEVRPLGAPPPNDLVVAADRSPAAVTAATDIEPLEMDSTAQIRPAIRDMLREGRAALAAADTDAAVASFEEAMAADPHNPQIPVHAAVAALEQNHPATAVALLKPAASRFPAAAAVHRSLGVAYYRLGDYASAQVALRQALSLDNTSGLSYLLMGCTLEKLGQPAAAQMQFERAAALSPRWRNMPR